MMQTNPRQEDLDKEQQKLNMKHFKRCWKKERFLFLATVRPPSIQNNLFEKADHPFNAVNASQQPMKKKKHGKVR